MNSLIDFVTFTKGIEYIIAVIFLFGFIGFWKLLFEDHHGGAREGSLDGKDR